MYVCGVLIGSACVVFWLDMWRCAWCDMIQKLKRTRSFPSTSKSSVSIASLFDDSSVKFLFEKWIEYKWFPICELRSTIQILHTIQLLHTIEESNTYVDLSNVILSSFYTLPKYYNTSKYSIQLHNTSKVPYPGFTYFQVLQYMGSQLLHTSKVLQYLGSQLLHTSL